MMTIDMLRKSLAMLIVEAAAAQGIECKHEYEPITYGRNGYRLNGEWMTPGDAAKRLGIEWGSTNVTERSNR